MFTERQRTMLIACGRNADHPKLGQENTALDAVIAQLKLEASKQFLMTLEDYSNRRFYDEPKTAVYYKSFVKGVPNDEK